jgi:hypothetical protein
MPQTLHRSRWTWVTRSPLPCQVVCASLDPMLDEAALPPPPVQGPAPWKVSASLAISSPPNSVDRPTFHVEPTPPDPMQVEEEVQTGAAQAKSHQGPHY